MYKVGRNDPCPCGSGKKYKKCCLNKLTTDKFEVWKVNAAEILSDDLCKDEIIKAYFNILDFIDKNNWAGACHAVSAVLYVLLSEVGLKPVLCVGEVKCDRGYFDHSWLEINGQVFDVAIYKNLDYGMEFAPVLNGYDIDSMKPTIGIYGVKSGIGLDYTAQMIINTPFDQYMGGFTDYQNGLWGIVIDLGMRMSLKLDISQLKRKYSDTKWTFKKDS